MKVTYEKRLPCVCGRDSDHEHRTMEQYVLIERDKDGTTAEIYLHGYDGESDHVEDFIHECKRDNPRCTYGLKLLRTINI